MVIATIVTPDVFARLQAHVLARPPPPLEGVLQNQDGAVSVKANLVHALKHSGPENPVPRYRRV